jgi:hypothetical protein
MLEVCDAADLRIEVAMVDHVVAVRAARPCAQIGRTVQVADPELRQIRYERSRVSECEATMQLHPVGGAGDRHQRRRGGGGRRFPPRAWPFVPEHRRQRIEACVLGPAVERHRQLAPPVGLRARRAGEIGLLYDAEDILELYDEQA